MGPLVKTFRRDGIYRHRFMWWFPWGVTNWWLPRVSRGGDEWCNDSLVFTTPPLGAFVIFWRLGRRRTMPCPADWAGLPGYERADYAPCGQYWNGRISGTGHAHWETGVCDEARRWLDDLPREYV